MEHKTSTVKKSKHCFILLMVEKVRWKGRSSPEPTELLFQTRLQQVIKKKIFSFDTYIHEFAYYIIYMLEFFYFRLMQDNLFHVAIVKYSTWAEETVLWM